MGKKPRKNKTADDADVRRENFKRWLELNNLNANEAAKKAEISVSAIYNFLNGDTKSLSSTLLTKLAIKNNSSVDDILNGQISLDKNKHSRHTVPVLFRVGGER